MVTDFTVPPNPADDGQDLQLTPEIVALLSHLVEQGLNQTWLINLRGVQVSGNMDLVLRGRVFKSFPIRALADGPLLVVQLPRDAGPAQQGIFKLPPPPTP